MVHALPTCSPPSWALTVIVPEGIELIATPPRSNTMAPSEVISTREASPMCTRMFSNGGTGVTTVFG